jgi:hypothetical protein
MAVVHGMTTGPIRGHWMRMNAFMLVGMAVQVVYSLIDLYWVGNLGKDAVAAVGLLQRAGRAVGASVPLGA